MSGPSDWMKLALRLVDIVAERRPESVAGRFWGLLRGREKTAPDPDREVLGHVDGALLKESLPSLEGMLKEIDDLARELPDDAKPIGIAARSLVERSIEECQKPLVDAARLTRDMQQVGQLALAMRERLLLSPWMRKPTQPN